MTGMRGDNEMNVIEILLHMCMTTMGFAVGWLVCVL